MQRDKPNHIEYCTDPQLLGLNLSPAQETLNRALYGLPLNNEQLEIYSLCTNRSLYHAYDYAEAAILGGARSGKDSRIACPAVSDEAAFGDHDKKLARGERATIALVAPGREQTAIAFNYLKSHFTDSKLLSSMLAEEPTEGKISLTNRVDIRCFPCTKSSLRGWSIPAAVMDEVAFFRLEDSIESDAEIQASIRRGMIGFARTKLVKISTPYMRSGVLYEDFKNHFGKDSPDLLCWRAPSTLMNPSLKQSRLEREQRLDPQRFAREYLAEFAEDLDQFIPAHWVESAVVPGRRELPPVPGAIYVAGADTSGLGGGGNPDAFTLSIVHSQGEKVIQDVCRGWKKSRSNSLDLAGIVGEIARTVKAYGISAVTGDRYGAQWVVEAFAKEGVVYRQTDQDKSYFYTAVEPLFAQGRIELLDHPQLARELRMLERRPLPGGKIRIDHPRSAHDDYSNSLAIAAAIASQSKVDLENFIAANAGAPDRTFDPRRGGWLDQGSTTGGGSEIERLWDLRSFSSRRGWEL
jgi:hypothetical protein